MNRGDLQRLSNARIREARILFRASDYSGADYLAGYAIECALKARFAKGVKRHDFPDKGRSDKVFSHNFETLVKLARLSEDLKTGRESNQRFAANWEVVDRWSEQSRYSLSRTRTDAEEFLGAIVKGKDAVLP